MTIPLDPELERQIKKLAQAEGYPSPGAYLAELVRRDKQKAGGDQTEIDWAWQAIHQASGTTTRVLSTDEIIEMTRGESC